ncbi:hypothetical protein J4409_02120 [Candidatus Woesearchaeota archaeon]|nr:hypothetical protein [Candidatus Woesearchaeota archaeon]
MAGKKKQNLIAFTFIGIFRLVWYILKGIYVAVKFILAGIFSIFRKASEKRNKNIEDKTAEKERKNSMLKELVEIENEQGNFEDFKHILYEKQSTIGLILGARGTGKSALGLRVLENIASRTRKKVYAMGFKDLPRWIRLASNLEEVQVDSFLLIDESGITFSSRNFMKELNKFLSDLLLIARHKDLSVLFLTQNSANIDVNIIRQIDYLILKPSSLLQKDFERKKISEIYREKAEKFKKHKHVRGMSYIYSDSYLGFVSNELPSFWNDKISKSFR